MSATNNSKKVDCFAYTGSSCLILKDKYPKLEECEKCHFRKPRREVTGGKYYPHAAALEEDE